MNHVTYSINDCSDGCTVALIDVDRAGAYTFSLNGSRTMHGKLPQQLVDDAFAHLPMQALTGARYELTRDAPSLAAAETWTGTALIDATDRSGHRYGAWFPFHGATKNERDRTQLELWAQFYGARLMYEAEGRGARMLALRSALSRHMIASVMLTRTPCYGHCSHYTVTFDANGRATLTDGRGCASATARVPFDRVVETLGDAPYLAASYALRAEDVAGAHLRIATRDGQVFRTDAIDRTAWPRELDVIVARLDELVRLTEWQPRCPSP